MPGLTADAQQKLDCDPESWGCCWAEQVMQACTSIIPELGRCPEI